MLKKKFNLWKEQRRARKIITQHPDELQSRIFGEAATLQISPTENQANFEEYESPLEDYMEMVIQYGYIVMWSASFPLAPIIAFLLNVIEIRVDGYKLTNIVRRPFPAGAKSIGLWLPIMRFLSFAGIFTNASIIVITSDMVQTPDEQTRWFVWVITVNGLYILKEWIAHVIPEVPSLYKSASTW